MSHGLIEIDTPRLRLRRWRDTDRTPFAALCADPQVMAFFPAVQDRAASDASISAWQAQFDSRGWSNWALELRASGRFVGFAGLSVPRRVLPCSPCVEIGWRLAREHWGRGYATEAAQAALSVGFERLALEEIVSFTALGNQRSRAVMQRIGLRDSGEDFDHPGVPAGHALQRHCLYRLRRDEWAAARIALERADQPDIVALIDELDAYQKPLYPAESHHGIDIAALCAPNVLFAVARDAQGRALACGAVVLHGGYGELKRMFTQPAQRGRGLARALLARLEDEARARGCTAFKLETGHLQPEALGLYERCGYVRGGPFGDYVDDPHSVFMHKPAAPARDA